MRALGASRCNSRDTGVCSHSVPTHELDNRFAAESRVCTVGLTGHFPKVAPPLRTEPGGAIGGELDR